MKLRAFPFGTWKLSEMFTPPSQLSSFFADKVNTALIKNVLWAKGLSEFDEWRGLSKLHIKMCQKRLDLQFQENNRMENPLLNNNPDFHLSDQT